MLYSITWDQMRNMNAILPFVDAYMCLVVILSNLLESVQRNSNRFDSAQVPFLYLCCYDRISFTLFFAALKTTYSPID